MSAWVLNMSVSPPHSLCLRLLICTSAFLYQSVRLIYNTAWRSTRKEGRQEGCDSQQGKQHGGGASGFPCSDAKLETGDTHSRRKFGLYFFPQNVSAAAQDVRCGGEESRDDDDDGGGRTHAISHTASARKVCANTQNQQQQQQQQKVI